MKLCFLGTGAADYSRELLETVPDRFAPDIRRCSAAILGGKYLIDAGPHVLDSLRIAGYPAGAVTDLLMTHLHKDHFNPENIGTLAAGREQPLRIWVREDAELPEIQGTEIRRMKLYERYQVGSDLAVTGLPANHGQGARPQHFLMEYAGRKIYYALDGAWILNGAFNALKEAHLDLLILDGTCGDYIGDFRLAEHNSIPMIRMMLPSFATTGAIDDHTVIYISHLARTLHKSHAETSAICEASGFHVARDGLTIEV